MIVGQGELCNLFLDAKGMKGEGALGGGYRIPGPA